MVTTAFLLRIQFRYPLLTLEKSEHLTYSFDIKLFTNQ